MSSSNMFPANISSKEAAILLAVIDNNNSPLNVNWANVAAVTGLKNGNTASTRFGQIKKRLGLTGNTTTSVSSGGNRVNKPRAPANPHPSFSGHKDGRTPTRVRRIKATTRSYKLDTIEEEDEEAIMDFHYGSKQSKDSKDKANAETRYGMAASDNEEAEEEISMVEQVARGDFSDDGDEMDLNGLVVHEDSFKPANDNIASKAYAWSIDMENNVYDDFEDAVYGGLGAFERILNR